MNLIKKNLDPKIPERFVAADLFVEDAWVEFQKICHQERLDQIEMTNQEEEKRAFLFGWYAGRASLGDESPQTSPVYKD
jgi:hypothetical protein